VVGVTRIVTGEPVPTNRSTVDTSYKINTGERDKIKLEISAGGSGPLRPESGSDPKLAESFRLKNK
jgi:hypothetical protein